MRPSDNRGTVRHAVASGDTVTLEITFEGTHNSNLVTEQGTIPASGRRLYFDLLGMLTQFGAVPAATS
jgi:hypothetical protein